MIEISTEKANRQILHKFWCYIPLFIYLSLFSTEQCNVRRDGYGGCNVVSTRSVLRKHYYLHLVSVQGLYYVGCTRRAIWIKILFHNKYLQQWMHLYNVPCLEFDCCSMLKERKIYVGQSCKLFWKIISKKVTWCRIFVKSRYSNHKV